MSPIVEAWLQCYDAQTEFCVEEKTARVGNVTARAITTTLRTDEIIVAGGRAESGGFIAQMLASDFPDGTPPKFTVIEADGQALQVLGTNENNGILYLTAGDPASE